MRIITAGAGYTDIDAYGGIIAYAELLRRQGQEALAVTTAPLNESIPPIVREWPVELATEYAPKPDDTYTLIDVSEPDFFEGFVDIGRVEGVIDHHPGKEAFWQEKIGSKARIEHVGAACTQVYEEWKVAGLQDEMSETSARLLMCGILDNTLNFGAKITNNRDHMAYRALSRCANLPENWPSVYFRNCQKTILADLATSIKNDTKTPALVTGQLKPVIGQLALWDGAAIATQSEATFKDVLKGMGELWFMNLISIGEGRNYFVTDSLVMQQWLHKVLGVDFDGNIAVADRMWLRKEIFKADIEHAG